MIKAIVLDIGGVLLRTEDHTRRRKLEEQYGLPKGGVDTLVFGSEQAKASTIGTAEPDSIWQNVAEKLNLSPEALKDFIQFFWEGDQIDHELIEFLEKCRPDYTTALLSNAWKNARQVFAHEYGIVEDETVDYILISSEHGVAKPDYQIYRILKDTIDLDYGEILFVDDFIENIQAANTLGIHTIHYQTGMNLINQIKSTLE
jgi:HAD superfamily hydrolase (TIGR01509 family)